MGNDTNRAPQKGKRSALKYIASLSLLGLSLITVNFINIGSIVSVSPTDPPSVSPIGPPNEVNPMEMAHGYIEAGNYVDAAAIYNTLNDTIAHINLGWMYENGLGLNKDLDKAETFYAMDDTIDGKRYRLHLMLNRFSTGEWQEDDVVQFSALLKDLVESGDYITTDYLSLCVSRTEFPKEGTPEDGLALFESSDIEKQLLTLEYIETKTMSTVPTNGAGYYYEPIGMDYDTSNNSLRCYYKIRIYKVVFYDRLACDFL